MLGAVENSKKTKSYQTRQQNVARTPGPKKTLYVQEAFADQRPKQLNKYIQIPKQTTNKQTKGSLEAKNNFETALSTTPKTY